MKRQDLALLALLPLLASLLLIACQPGHDGTKIIGYLKDGQLWTVDANGANSFAIAKQEVPVIGYSWSPNHQIVAFRTLDTDFARTPDARTLLAEQRPGGLRQDVPSAISTVGIDGGTPIVVAFSNTNARYSNATWNPSGNRLLIRQTSIGGTFQAGDATWWLTQNDQPGGIAAKIFPTSYALPSFGYTNDLVAGIADRGLFTTTLAATQQQALTNQALTGHPLPAGLERVLWQPQHQDTSLLYAQSVASQPASSEHPIQVQLISRSLKGGQRVLATCACTQFAWSPDGSSILYTTGTSFTILPLNQQHAFTFHADQASTPSWSPDGRFLLLNSPRSLMLVDVVHQRTQTLLSGSTKAEGLLGNGVDSKALLQPLPNSPWAADSQHFLFLTQQRLSWQGKRLAQGEGLYTVSLTPDGGLQGAPTLVATGAISQPGWTYQDPNTSFLF